MFKLLIASIAAISSIAFAHDDEARYLECNSTNFRQNGGWEIQPNDNAYLALKMEEGQDQPIVTVVNGYINFGGYVGFMTDLVVTPHPYVRTPGTYKNHNRWEMNAERTYGHEDGMWGHLIVNFEAMSMGRYDRTDAHFYLQAGDHQGGTVDFECERVFGF
ncbi:MAG: hypothetical protein AAF202_09355 [Pseudomonadota bacterium]